MAKWIDRSHPQVVTGAVILGYIAAFGALIALLGNTGRSLVPNQFQLLFLVAFAAGAYGTANNKKLAHLVLGVAASFEVVFQTLALVSVSRLSATGLVQGLFVLNTMVFSVALLFAVFHRQTLEYRKTFFE